MYISVFLRLTLAQTERAGMQPQMTTGSAAWKAGRELNQKINL
jgi:hypothetical protein